MKLIIVAGLNNSGPDHWQNFWQNHFPETIKVEQIEWDFPQLTDWLNQMNQTISSTDRSQPYILVGHSLGCVLCAHWLAQNDYRNVVGAMLVAPADVDSELHTPDYIWNFSPIPKVQFSIPTVVVASENDPYMTIERSKELANSWGSEFYNFGPLGHINSDCKLGLWPEGQAVLEALKRSIEVNSLNNQ
ncbi:MAG TPA: alpha/beta hydrolase [Saprospiraceae bacterium]|nr:alpha/beta hydrolase [Saprospiraceae bacterium]HPN70695.1 alpha/beta hydrolase [Saprospiraceae bacterium]